MSGGLFATYVVDVSSPWEIHHKDFPGLPQVEWFANLAAANTLSIIEIKLTDWPQSNGD
jgi:hypothetical protein